MSSDDWMYARIAELEARLELANKQLWETEQKLAAAQQKIHELTNESDRISYNDYLRYIRDDLK